LSDYQGKTIRHSEWGLSPKTTREWVVLIVVRYWGNTSSAISSHNVISKVVFKKVGVVDLQTQCTDEIVSKLDWVELTNINRSLDDYVLISAFYNRNNFI